MKREPLIAAALAAALVLGATIAPATAYFTDTTQATGGHPVKVGTSTDMKEWYAEKQKHVTISNDEDSAQPVWLRAKVFSPVEFSAAGQGWPTSPDVDGWYEYSSVVEPGASTEELVVTLTFPEVKSDKQPDGAVYGDNVNVVVVYESVPANHGAGESAYEAPDWTAVLDRG